MSALKRLLICVVWSSSLAAFAQAPKPSVMPFPLEIKRAPSGFGSEEREGLQKEYTRLLRLAGALVPDFARYDLALRELKRQDCEREDECLVQLARKAEALYGLYASVDYTLEGAVVVSGRVVREDGKVVSPIQTVKLARGRDPFKEIAKNALAQLFTQLKIAELSATRPVEAAVDPQKKDPPMNPIKDPPPPLPPLIVEDTGAGQRSAGRALLYGGAGLAVVGGVLAGAGCGVGCGVTPNANGTIPEGQLEAARTGRALMTAGFVGLAAGAAVAGLGAILWGTAAPPPAAVTLVPVSGGGVVQIGGQF